MNKGSLTMFENEIAWNYHCRITSKMLAEEFNVIPAAITYWARKKGIETKSRSRTNKLSVMDRDCLAWDYYQGFSLRELALEYGTHRNSVDHWKKMKRVPEKRNMVKNVNDAKFDTLTSESSYWLGFLMADGCIRETGENAYNLAINLCEKDVGHLYKLRHWLGSSCTISYAEKTKSYGMAIYSTKLAKKIMEYGIVPRKSLIAEAPIILENNRDFWRGVIDGDGYIGFDGKRNVRLQLDGSYALVQQFLEFVKNIIDTRVDIASVNNHFCLRLGGSNNVPLILAILYDDAVFYLDRKKEVVNEILMKFPCNEFRTAHGKVIKR